MVVHIGADIFRDGMRPNNLDSELSSLFQTASRLGIAPRRLRAAVDAGELPGYQPGSRTIYLRWPEVLGWLRTQRVASSDHARQRSAEIISQHSKQKETAAG